LEDDRPRCLRDRRGVEDPFDVGTDERRVGADIDLDASRREQDSVGRPDGKIKNPGNQDGQDERLDDQEDQGKRVLDTLTHWYNPIATGDPISPVSRDRNRRVGR
jgi:hypothetical protein